MTTIKVKDLKKNYGDFQALKGISFEVEKGEILGFLGPNGAGKTTTMKILTGFIRSTSGKAEVLGYKSSEGHLEMRSKVGYLAEHNPLYHEMIVKEYLEYIGELSGLDKKNIKSRLKKVVYECGLSEKIASPIHTLSKGFKQRVGLASVLIHDPEILILDEPTAGLDPNQMIEIRQLIKELGEEKTVILCSHHLAEVEKTCNRVVIINHGKIVAAGTPNELRKLSEGQANLKLTIKGVKQEVIKSLKEINGVKKIITKKSKERGATDYFLTTKKRDLRDQIVHKMVENDFKLLEIHKESISLEEVFNQLTNEE